MEIIPLGHSSFKLKGKTASVVLDPYNSEAVGLKFPRHITADIVTISHHHLDHNFTAEIEPETDVVKIFKWPGEYEVKGVEITGIGSFHDDKNGTERGSNTIFKIDIDGLTLVHLGDLGTNLSESEIEILNGVDILFVPVGETYTLEIRYIIKLISDIEPKIVIPMHYHRPGYKIANLKEVGEFLNQIDQKNITPLPKIKVTKDTLPDKMQVVILE